MTLQLSTLKFEEENTDFSYKKNYLDRGKTYSHQ